MEARSYDLDLMTTSGLVDLFLSEELKTILCLKKQRANIVRVVDLLSKSIERKGRIIYIGSGTSGRLGVLDAAECKPTFSTNSFFAVMAGGKMALFHAIEGLEDNTKAAVKDLKRLNVTGKDVVVGISASGETPYTVSAIKFARRCGAKTVAITSSGASRLSKTAHFRISPDIGKEIISGSSRLKSGTAQKIILNMLSSITMIKNKKVYKDLMIDVQPTNKKLILRAIKIISVVCGVPLKKAKSIFFKAKRNTKAAIVMHFKKCSLEAAKKLLKKVNFDLRKIIG